MLQTQRPHFFRQIMAVAARCWTFINAATAEDRSRTRAVTCAAGAFLTIDLLGGVADFRPGFHLMRTSLRIVTLPAHNTMQDVDTWLKTKQCLIQINRTGFAAVEFDDI